MAGSLSTFTSLSAFGYPLPERSEATPGLWNNIFSGLSANLDTLNSSVSQFVGLSSVGTAQVIGGFSTNTLTTQSGNTITLLPGGKLLGASIDSGGQLYNVNALGGTIEAAIAALPGGTGTILVPGGFAENITTNITLSSSSGVRVMVMPGAVISIGTGGTLTFTNNGIWDQPGGIINVTKTGGDAIVFNGGWSRLILGQLNYTGPSGGTSNAIVFTGAQFCRTDIAQIKSFGGSGLLFGRTGQAQGTLNNRAIVEFINSCGTLIAFASGVTGVDATPFDEGNRVFCNLASVFTTAGVSFGDGGTRNDCEFNEVHGDAHDTSAGGLVPVIFNDGQYCYYDGNLFTDNGAARLTFNANAKFNVARCANLGVAGNVTGAGLYQNTLLSENLIQAVSINSITWSPVRVGNNAPFQGTAANNVTVVNIAKVGTDNFIHIGDSSRTIFLDAGAGSVVNAGGPIQGVSGTALLPASAFSSEASLGFYLSGTSHIGLSYGAISLPDGTALLPSRAYSSESSLGWYRSGVSTLALSYGSFNLNQGRLVSARTLAGSAVTASATNTNIAKDEVVFTVTLISGASLCINSGGTTWIFNSASSAKQT